MRRLLAILIVFALGLPAMSPLFALTGAADLSVPACCRRDGKHHCAGMAAMAAETRAVSFNSKTQAAPAIVSERCPYGSYSLPGPARRDSSLHPAAAIFAGVVAHPAVVPRVESRRRVSADRARHKRGPPAALPLA